MFFPYSTDAPLYHRPLATAGLIVANVLVFVWSANAGQGDVLALALIRGDGIHPLQWLTSNFIHGGVGHVAANMVFLWVFGMIIEGKVGPWRFLACALGIGVAESAIEQVASLPLAGPSYSYGASAMVFGLVGMALVWAPANDVTFTYWILYRGGTVDVTVKTTAIFYAVIELLGAIPEFRAGELGASVLHLLGGLLGFGLGVFMLRRGWVDCDGWDLFSRRVARGGSGVERRRRERAVESSPEDDTPAPEPSEREFDRKLALELLDSNLVRGDLDAAWIIHSEDAEADPEWELPRKSLFLLLRLLQGAKRWDDLRPLLCESLERFPARATSRKLALARIYLDYESRATKGGEVLDTIDPAELDDLELVHYRRLRRKAEQLEALGVPDLGVDD